MEIDLTWLRPELRNPFWYKRVATLAKEVKALSETNHQVYEVVKELIYDEFEEALLSGTIPLGDEVGIWDEERVEVDRIIIHDTSNRPGLSPLRLSAIELFRIYGPYYANPTDADRPRVEGKLVSSGHVRGNKQVFYPYHWVIHEDGTATRLLSDAEVGWQAGKWGMNCRSVAICLDGDFDDARPDRQYIAGAARIICKRYKELVQGVTNRKVLGEIILGHREVNEETICPSRLFLSKDGQRGWKEDLLDLVLAEIQNDE
jgi:hypothetical protein